MDDNDKNYVHVSKVVDFVQKLLMTMEHLTGASVNDLSIVLAAELKKCGIIDGTNFLNHCRQLVYFENKSHRIH